MPYVYHFKPSNMHGEYLIPLNELKAEQPEAYKDQVKKYKGREKLLDKKIPLLDCLWNDVLHFSPISPQVIMDSWRAHGLYEYAALPSQIEVYKIPIKQLAEGSTVCYQSHNFDFYNHNPDLDKFWRLNNSEFSEQLSVEEKQIEVWKNDYKKGRVLLWYSHTTHVLAKQKLDTRSCELVVCQ